MLGNIDVDLGLQLHWRRCSAVMVGHVLTQHSLIMPHPFITFFIAFTLDSRCNIPRHALETHVMNTTIRSVKDTKSRLPSNFQTNPP